MAIEFKCGQCSSVLRVPDEHAGKQAKCPSCGAVNAIPAASPVGLDIPTSVPQSNVPPVSPPQPAANPFPPVGQPKPNPYAGGVQPGNSTSFRRNWSEPHRGTMVMVLGIMGIVMNCAGIPGIMAWVMGSADLKKMKAGVMDPEGESQTRAGMIMGIIGTVFAAIGLVIFLVYIIIIVVVVAGAAAAGP